MTADEDDLDEIPRASVVEVVRDADDAEKGYATTRTPADLTDGQIDGLACIGCGRDLTTAGTVSVPAGVRERGQVSACAEHGETCADDAKAWMAACESRLRERLAGMPLPIGATDCGEWSVDLDDTGTRTVYWFAEKIAHVHVSVEALQDQDGNHGTFGTDVYATSAEPISCDEVTAIAAAMATAADVANVAGIAHRVHAEMLRSETSLEQLAPHIGFEPDELHRRFSTDMEIHDLRRVRKALGAEWSDLLPENLGRRRGDGRDAQVGASK